MRKIPTYKRSRKHIDLFSKSNFLNIELYQIEEKNSPLEMLNFDF